MALQSKHDPTREPDVSDRARIGIPRACYLNSVTVGEALEVHLNLVRTIFVFDTHGHRGGAAFVDFDKLIGSLLVRRVCQVGRETLRLELIVIKFGNIVDAARGSVRQRDRVSVNAGCRFGRIRNWGQNQVLF
jgi:hypothetical protein